MSLERFIIENRDVTMLSNNSILEIAKIEKDMWAYWIWEYVKCNNCWNIYSKNDIYKNIELNIRLESVTKIEEILWWDSIKCLNCNWNTEFIYDIDNNILDIKNRLYNSKKSFISLLLNENDWEINWFLDWYIDSFENIFKREFESHYWNLWIKFTREFIEKKIWYLLENDLFSFSSMWTNEKYKNFYILFQMIQNFFSSIPDEYNNILWITELDSWKSLNAIYSSMWAQKIWIWSNNQIINKNNNYNSDLFYHENVVLDYKKNFSLPIREFIKKYKQSMILVLQN